MPALNVQFNDASFASFLSKPISQISTDLSNASTLEVLTKYEIFKRKSNPKYTLSPVRYQIGRIQQQFGVEIFPLQITDEFWQHFQMFLLINDVKGSSVKNYCSSIVRALNWGVRHHLEVSPTYDAYDRNMCKYDKTRVVLTPDDVSMIAHFDISSIPVTIKEDEHLALATKQVDKETEDIIAKIKNELSIQEKKIREECESSVAEIKGGKYKRASVVTKHIRSCGAKRLNKINYVRSRANERIEMVNKSRDRKIQYRVQCLGRLAVAKHKQYLNTLERVRDQFILQCNLGQRYSDICRIEPSCFSEDKSTYTCVQQKTGNKAVVDIKKFCFDKNVMKALLEKYNYSSPYPCQINIFNAHLHELLKLIGGRFNEMVKTENKVRGEIVTEVVPKWQAIASHTARRSFVSYNVKRGIIEAEIRRASGHSDSKSFAKYLIWEDGE